MANQTVIVEEFRSFPHGIAFVRSYAQETDDVAALVQTLKVEPAYAKRVVVEDNGQPAFGGGIRGRDFGPRFPETFGPRTFGQLAAPLSGVSP